MTGCARRCGGTARCRCATDQSRAQRDAVAHDPDRQHDDAGGAVAAVPRRRGAARVQHRDAVGHVHRHLFVAVYRGPAALLRAAEPARDRQGRRAGTPTPAPPARSGPRAEAGMELDPADPGPGARSSSATRRAGSGSAARSISVRCWCFPTAPRPGRRRRLPWRAGAGLAHGGVELLLLGFGRRMRRSRRHCAAR